MADDSKSRLVMREMYIALHPRPTASGLMRSNGRSRAKIHAFRRYLRIMAAARRDEDPALTTSMTGSEPWNPKSGGVSTQRMPAAAHRRVLIFRGPVADDDRATWPHALAGGAFLLARDKFPITTGFFFTFDLINGCRGFFGIGRRFSPSR